MAGKPAGEKSEKATPRKIKKARSEGQISHSHELGSWVSILAATVVLPKVAKALMAMAEGCLVNGTAMIDNPDPASALSLLRQTAMAGTKAVAPLVLLVLITSVASAGTQGGIHVSPKILMPKFSRLNPLHGLKRMFGTQGVWQLVKSLVKTAVLAAVTYLAVRHLVPTVMGAGSMPLSAVLTTTVDAALNVVRFGAVAGVIMSFADVAVVRRRNNKSLKMTKQEVKEEHKQSDGDPQLRSAIRARAMAISRNRMMADVPTADVVVVNPTHIAIALKYDPAKGAPRVVAMGKDHVALRIRELAAENRIPLVQDVPLARTMIATCKVGQEIPADLYQGVATVLAFIMRLRKRGSVAGMHRVTPALAH